MSSIAELPRVATIASLAGRRGLQEVVTAILPQVDRLYVYLDGYETPPAFLQGLDRVTVGDAGELHCSSRFLCLAELEQPSLVVVVDDDIIYPPDYVERMAAHLDALDGEAVFGVHGRIFTPPHRSYATDAVTIHFTAPYRISRNVHEVGGGTCAFVSDRLPLDPRGWGGLGMDDIQIALEAQRRGLPRLVVARGNMWLRPMAEEQADSLWRRTRRDDAVHSLRMRELLALYG